MLYTKDKALKKAVGFAFETLGFSVKLLPDGTNPDIEISNEERAICEVKGHENKQSDRKDMLQLVGYSTEEGKAVKSIFVSNHEFSKKPAERNTSAFTEAAIDLAKKTCISLISTVDLYEIVMKVLQKTINEQQLKEIRKQIMNGEGITSLKVGSI